MHLNPQITQALSSPIGKALLIVLGLLALYLALKIGKFILKIMFCLIGLALLAMAVWWWFFRQ